MYVEYIIQFRLVQCGQRHVALHHCLIARVERGPVEKCANKYAPHGVPDVHRRIETK